MVQDKGVVKVRRGGEQRVGEKGQYGFVEKGEEGLVEKGSSVWQRKEEGFCGEEGVGFNREGE